jgi:hypothetical protein
MASNWRLTKRDIAHIAHALEELKGKKLPKELHGEERFTQDELNAISSRFTSAAIANDRSSVLPGKTNN